MKAKTLRFKDTKEYIHIENFGGEPMVCTGELPNLHPMTATIELMKKVSEAEDMEDLFDFDNMEFVELDIFDAGEVGADIRNKLSPSLNLVEMLEVYFAANVAHASQKRAQLAKSIKKEMKQSKISIEYLAKLL